MLMAHSEVFQRQLEESELKEKQDVPIKDIHPDTFRGMLKYVYGHDTTKDMCFDEADNLFYVAEKYLMKTLKDKLALRLMDLLNPDNICSLLNNPACHTHLELDSAITKILRYETDRVLESQQFLWMNADGFLKILEQDGLAVTEIELWRAAIKWAKSKTNLDDGRVLRQQLSGLTPHLRLCTLTAEEFCTDVAPTRVLDRDEIGAVCESIGRKQIPQGLSDISNCMKPRKLLRKKKVRRELVLSYLDEEGDGDCGWYSWKIFTKNRSIELLSLLCGTSDCGPEPRTYGVDCTTTITKVNPDSSADEPPVTVDFSEVVKKGDEFEIPLTVRGKNITLLANSEYRVEMRLDGHHKRYHKTYYKRNYEWYDGYCSDYNGSDDDDSDDDGSDDDGSDDNGSDDDGSDDDGSLGNDHLKLVIPLDDDDDGYYYLLPFSKLVYRV